MPGVARATPSRQREAPPTRSQSASWSISRGSSRRQVSVTARLGPTATSRRRRPSPSIIAMIAPQNRNTRMQQRSSGAKIAMAALTGVVSCISASPKISQISAQMPAMAPPQNGTMPIGSGAAVRVGERAHGRFEAVLGAAEQRQRQVDDAGVDEEARRRRRRTPSSAGCRPCRGRPSAPPARLRRRRRPSSTRRGRSAGSRSSRGSNGAAPTA